MENVFEDDKKCQAAYDLLTTARNEVQIARMNQVRSLLTNTSDAPPNPHRPPIYSSSPITSENPLSEQVSEFHRVDDENTSLGNINSIINTVETINKQGSPPLSRRTNQGGTSPRKESYLDSFESDPNINSIPELTPTQTAPTSPEQASDDPNPSDHELQFSDSNLKELTTHSDHESNISEPVEMVDLTVDPAAVELGPTATGYTQPDTEPEELSKIYDSSVARASGLVDAPAEHAVESITESGVESVSPVTESIIPASEPVSEPIAEGIAGLAEPVVEPIADSSATSEPATEPAAEPVPVIEPEPVTESVVESEPATQPGVNPEPANLGTEPVAVPETTVGLVTDPTSEPEHDANDTEFALSEPHEGVEHTTVPVAEAPIHTNMQTEPTQTHPETAQTPSTTEHFSSTPVRDETPADPSTFTNSTTPSEPSHPPKSVPLEIIDTHLTNGNGHTPNDLTNSANSDTDNVDTDAQPADDNDDTNTTTTQPTAPNGGNKKKQRKRSKKK